MQDTRDRSMLRLAYSLEAKQPTGAVFLCSHTISAIETLYFKSKACLTV